MIPASLQKHLTTVRENGEKIVLATGVFDVLHQEHIFFLQKAKKLGGFLVVGLESDIRVQKMKGQNRPVFSQKERKTQLEALGIADAVFILPEIFDLPEHHSQLIRDISPDFFAVSEQTPHLEEKKKVLQAHGSRLVVVHEHNPSISTTQILKKNSEQSLERKVL